MENGVLDLWEGTVNREQYQQILDREIQKGFNAMFPHGAGRATYQQVQHWLNTIAQVAFREGRSYALMGLMTAEDVAQHFQITPRRARALIQNRHERFAVGMKMGNSWLVHRDELDDLRRDKRYHIGNSK